VKKWQAIVFDLDDTLYPERDYVFSGFAAVATWAEKNLALPADQSFIELKHLFEQGVYGVTFNHWLTNHGLIADSLLPKLVEIYRNHQPKLSPFSEVPTLLSSLHQRYRLGLISDGYVAVQKRKLATLNLAHYFDAVIFSDEWGQEAWKPNPLPFQIILEKLAVTGPNSVYVADNPLKDFIGARQVGMWTLRVRTPQGIYSHVEPPSPSHAPDIEVRDFNNLERILMRIHNPNS
jgi:putative hydrolase of the HAD superfamily